MFVLPRTQTYNFQNRTQLANGLNKVSTNELALFTNNVNRLHIDNTGNVGIGTSDPQYKLHINGTMYVDTATINSLTIDNDITVRGNLTVQGTTTTIDSTSLTVDDSMIRLADNNPDDLIDIGFYGMYIDAGVTKFTGIYRDASTNKMHWFANDLVEPTDTHEIENPYITVDTDTGYVGIGLTNPAYVFDVDGAAQIKNDMVVQGNLYIKGTTSDGFSDIGNLWGLSGSGQGDIYLREIAGRVAIGVTTATHDLTVHGDIGVSGAIVPTVTETFDLGTTGLRFRDLYMSGSSIHLGDSVLSTLGGNLQIDGTTASTQWSDNGSDIYFNSGNVGIGVTNPSDLLHIQGGDLLIHSDGNNATGLRINQSANGIYGNVDVQNAGTTNELIMNMGVNYSQGGGTRVLEQWGGFIRVDTRVANDQLFSFRSVNTSNVTTSLMTIDFNGNVSIGGNIEIQDTQSLTTENLSKKIQLDERSLSVLQDTWSANIEIVGGSNSGLGNNWDGGPWNFYGGDVILRGGHTSTGATNNGTAAAYGYGGDIKLYPGYAHIKNQDIGQAAQGYSGEIIFYRYTGNGLNSDGIPYSESFKIDRGGNVGIGTNSPLGLLHVYGSTSVIQAQGTNSSGEFQVGLDIIPQSSLRGRGLRIRNGTDDNKRWIVGNKYNSSQNNLNFLYTSTGEGTNMANYTEFMTITTAGNVGIGTIAPGAKLDVYGEVILRGTTDTTIDGGIFTETNFERCINFDHQTATYRNYYMGLLGDGTNNTNKLAFGVDAGGGSDPNMIMAMDNAGNVMIDGNVGIGTNNPGAKLQVDVIDAGTAGLFINQQTDAIDNIAIRIQGTQGTDTLWEHRVGFGGGSAASYYRIRDATAGADRLVIDTSGNVGIGTLNPDRKLEVVGEVGGNSLTCQTIGSLGYILVDEFTTTTLQSEAYATEVSFGTDGTDTFAHYQIHFNAILPYNSASNCGVVYRFYDNSVVYSGANYYYQANKGGGTSLYSNSNQSQGICVASTDGGSASSTAYCSGVLHVFLSTVHPQISGIQSAVRETGTAATLVNISTGVDIDKTFTKITGIGFSGSNIDTGSGTLNVRIFRML